VWCDEAAARAGQTSPELHAQVWGRWSALVRSALSDALLERLATLLTPVRHQQWIVFEGISVDETGKQHFLDASVAYKRAVLNAVDYLSKFGYSREQIYLLLSCAPSEGRISGWCLGPGFCRPLVSLVWQCVVALWPCVVRGA